MPDADAHSPVMPLTRVLRTWWPLCLSWALMTLEGPSLSATISRLPDARIHLAAWGGVVMPFVMVIGAPVIMLLSASTALSHHRQAYRVLRRFCLWLSLALTLIHAAIAFTPLYDVIAQGVLNAPQEILEPGRTGLQIVLPWALAVAIRRLQQGVMIRHGYAKSVTTGTALRLVTNVAVLLTGFALRTVPGIVVGASAISAGIVAEMIYTWVRGRAILRTRVPEITSTDSPLTMSALLAFYIPLVLTSLLNILVQPIGSAAISRMPEQLASLATWPVVNGLLFLLRSPGLALNETVIALRGEQSAVKGLKRFAVILFAACLCLMIIVVTTPLSDFWFDQLMGLPDDLKALGRQTLSWSLLLPALVVVQSWFSGALVHYKRTSYITESVAGYLVTVLTIMGLGIVRQRTAGLIVISIGYTAASLVQIGWLWLRTREMIRNLQQEAL